MTKKLTLDYPVVRVTDDPEGIFIRGKAYVFSLTESDFIFRGKVCIEGAFFVGEDIEQAGLWSVDEFNEAFKQINN